MATSPREAHAAEAAAQELLARLSEKPEVLSLAQQTVATTGGKISAVLPVDENKKVTVSLQPATSDSSSPSDTDAVPDSAEPQAVLEVTASVEDTSSASPAAAPVPPLPAGASAEMPQVASFAAPANPFAASEEEDESFDLIAPMLKQRAASGPAPGAGSGGTRKAGLDTSLLAAVKHQPTLISVGSGSEASHSPADSTSVMASSSSSLRVGAMIFDGSRWVPDPHERNGAIKEQEEEAMDLFDAIVGENKSPASEGAGALPVNRKQQQMQMQPPHHGHSRSTSADDDDAWGDATATTASSSVATTTNGSTTGSLSHGSHNANAITREVDPAGTSASAAAAVKQLTAFPISAAVTAASKAVGRPSSDEDEDDEDWDSLPPVTKAPLPASGPANGPSSSPSAAAAAAAMAQALASSQKTQDGARGPKTFTLEDLQALQQQQKQQVSASKPAGFRLSKPAPLELQQQPTPTPGASSSTSMTASAPTTATTGASSISATSTTSDSVVSSGLQPQSQHRQQLSDFADSDSEDDRLQQLQQRQQQTQSRPAANVSANAAPAPAASVSSTSLRERLEALQRQVQEHQDKKRREKQERQQQQQQVEGAVGGSRPTHHHARSTITNMSGFSFGSGTLDTAGVATTSSSAASSSSAADSFSSSTASSGWSSTVTPRQPPLTSTTTTTTGGTETFSSPYAAAAAAARASASAAVAKGSPTSSGRLTAVRRLGPPVSSAVIAEEEDGVKEGRHHHRHSKHQHRRTQGGGDGAMPPSASAHTASLSSTSTGFSSSAGEPATATKSSSASGTKSASSSASSASSTASTSAFHLTEEQKRSFQQSEAMHRRLFGSLSSASALSTTAASASSLAVTFSSSMSSSSSLSGPLSSGSKRDPLEAALPLAVGVVAMGSRDRSVGGSRRSSSVSSTNAYHAEHQAAGNNKPAESPVPKQPSPKQQVKIVSPQHDAGTQTDYVPPAPAPASPIPAPPPRSPTVAFSAATSTTPSPSASASASASSQPSSPSNPSGSGRGSSTTILTQMHRMFTAQGNQMAGKFSRSPPSNAPPSDLSGGILGNAQKPNAGFANSLFERAMALSTGMGGGSTPLIASAGVPAPVTAPPAVVPPFARAPSGVFAQPFPSLSSFRNTNGMVKRSPTMVTFREGSSDKDSETTSNNNDQNDDNDRGNFNRMQTFRTDFSSASRAVPAQERLLRRSPSNSGTPGYTGYVGASPSSLAASSPTASKPVPPPFSSFSSGFASSPSGLYPHALMTSSVVGPSGAGNGGGPRSEFSGMPHGHSHHLPQNHPLTSLHSWVRSLRSNSPPPSNALPSPHSTDFDGMDGAFGGRGALGGTSRSAMSFLVSRAQAAAAQSSSSAASSSSSHDGLSYAPSTMAGRNAASMHRMGSAASTVFTSAYTATDAPALESLDPEAIAAFEASLASRPGGARGRSGKGTEAVATITAGLRATLRSLSGARYHSPTSRAAYSSRSELVTGLPAEIDEDGVGFTASDAVGIANTDRTDGHDDDDDGSDDGDDDEVMTVNSSTILNHLATSARAGASTKNKKQKSFSRKPSSSGHHPAASYPMASAAFRAASSAPAPSVPATTTAAIGSGGGLSSSLAARHFQHHNYAPPVPPRLPPPSYPAQQPNDGYASPQWLSPPASPPQRQQQPQYRAHGFVPGAIAGPSAGAATLIYPGGRVAESADSFEQTGASLDQAQRVHVHSSQAHGYPGHQMMAPAASSNLYYHHQAQSTHAGGGGGAAPAVSLVDAMLPANLRRKVLSPQHPLFPA